MARVIIAGGRNFVGTNAHCLWLVKKLKKLGATEIISGGCSGADKFGERAAKYLSLPCTIINADWKKNGMAAGPMRNEEMAKIADACILFPGGSGTHDMHRRAVEHGLRVIVYG